MSWIWQDTPPKPEDKIEYSLGFACEDEHCPAFVVLDTPIESVCNKERICRVCGEKAFPSVVKRIQSSHLCQGFLYNFWMYSYTDVTFEFVRFLDEDTVRLPDETVSRLKDFAARSFANVDEDAEVSYKNGLHDGASMAAQYVLGELKEESS